MNSMYLFTYLGACKVGSFFGLPRWYEYLQLDSQCRISSFTMPGDLLLIVLAIIDLLLHLAGLAAVIFVIYGGIQYVTSQGSPDATAKAQNTVVNALLGLAFAVVAIVFVSFLGKRLA